MTYLNFENVALFGYAIKRVEKSFEKGEDLCRLSNAAPSGEPTNVCGERSMNGNSELGDVSRNILNFRCVLIAYLP